MEVKKGRHGQVVLRGYVSGDCDIQVLRNESIKITIRNDGEAAEEILFQGVIQSTHLFCENGVNQVIISALTNDINLDKKENSRSYQDTSRTYAELMKSAVGSSGGEVLCDQASVKTGHPVIQYEETDWQFCRRMASEMGLAVFSNPASAYPQIDVGLVERGGNISFRTDQYKVCVDEDYYRIRGEGDEKKEFLYYQVEAEENYEIGSSARYQGQKRYIFEKTVELKNDVLVFQYKLGGKCRFTERKFYNEKISGAALSGKIEKTDKQSVYLKLDIDGKTAKAAYAYPWAPVTGNFMYCMPQTGTKAYLYFADSDERNARAVNSIRTNASYAGFANVQNRVLVTENGKQMQLYPDKLCFKGGKEEAEQNWCMATDDMLFQSKMGKMQVIGKEKIVFRAPEISLTAAQKIGQYKMAAYAQQKQSEICPKGSGNPATGGGDGVSELQNEYNALTSQGLLYGTVYEMYKPFADEPEYEEYKDAVPTWLKIAAGIAVAVAVGLAVGALVVATGGVAAAALGVTALQLGIFAGGVTAAAGIAATIATAKKDAENGTESSLGEYLSNSFSASAKVGGALAILFAAPYAAEAMTYSVMMPYASVNIMGATITTGHVLTAANLFTGTVALSNTLFQLNDVTMFATGQKELGAPTGNAYYDYTKQLSECLAYNIAFFALANPRLYSDAVENFSQIKQAIGIGSGTDIIELSNSNIQHIKKHTFEGMSEQANYLTDEQLANKLNNTSFFNKDWSQDEIIKYTQEAYNTLRSQGKIGLQSIEINGETINVFIKEDGTFDTAYGVYKYNVDDFR